MVYRPLGEGDHPVIAEKQVLRAKEMEMEGRQVSGGEVGQHCLPLPLA